MQVTPKWLERMPEALIVPVLLAALPVVALALLVDVAWIAWRGRRDDRDTFGADRP